MAFPIKTQGAMPDLSLAECDHLITAAEFYRDAVEAAQEALWTEQEDLRLAEARMSLEMAFPIKTQGAMRIFHSPNAIT